MKKNKIIIIILIALLLISLLVNLYTFSYKEQFDTNNNIDYYVISLRHEDRMKNIKEQEEKMGINVNIFDAVKGDYIDKDEYINKGILSPNYVCTRQDCAANNKLELREIGCYLSHLNLLKSVNKQDSYTVIFEDDFIINSDNFIDDVNDIIDNLDGNFDMIYLGCLQATQHNDLVKNNISNINKNISINGTYGYLINNNNVEKIVNNIGYITDPIDLKYEKLNHENILNSYIINPPIVKHNENGYSAISELNIETFYSMT